MSKQPTFLWCILLAFATLPTLAQVENTIPPAFPGAEGFGRFTTGGRGGEVIHVTNLNNSGTGSLRAAIEASGPRVVVFDVSGLIELNSSLVIRNGDITIAGQSAPGDGICLKNYSFRVDASNVIVRYIRSRMGDEKAHEGDAMEGRGTLTNYRENIIIDHCTLSWSTDECGSFYDIDNFTMQWCILAESLRESVHDKGTHGYGGIWGGHKASFHHNLLAHHDSRNPRMGGSRYFGDPAIEEVDFRNNVIYNWGNNSGYGGEGGSYNLVNNYYKPGAATKSSVRTRIFAPNPDDGSNQNEAGTHGYFYVDGNYMHGSASVTEDNWIGITPSGLTDAQVKSNSAFGFGQVTTHSAEDAYEAVLDFAGVSISRDVHDARVVSETRNGTTTYTGSITLSPKPGLIDTQTDVGGWPAYESISTPADMDNDGMPDSWEASNGLNAFDGTDHKDHDLSTFYTNIEVYLNSLVTSTTSAQLAAGTANYIDMDTDPSPEVPLALLDENAFVVYPSPVTKGTFTVKWSGASKETTVTLFTLCGRLKKSTLFTGPTAEMDVSDLPSGMYILRIQDGEKKDARKIIIR